MFCILSPTGSSCLHQYAEEWRPKERKVYPIPRGKSLWRHDMDLTLFEGNPTVTGGFPSQRASNVELEVCCCQFNQAFAQTVELPVVLDAMTLLWRHYDIEDSRFSAVQYRTWKSWEHVNRISKYTIHVIQILSKVLQSTSNLFMILDTPGTRNRQGDSSGEQKLSQISSLLMCYIERLQYAAETSLLEISNFKAIVMVETSVSM